MTENRRRFETQILVVLGLSLLFAIPSPVSAISRGAVEGIVFQVLERLGVTINGVPATSSDWASSLRVGNTSGGTDPIVSSGDDLELPDGEVSVHATGQTPGVGMDANGTFQADASGNKAVRLEATGHVDMRRGDGLRWSDSTTDSDGAKFLYLRLRSGAGNRAMFDDDSSEANGIGGNVRAEAAAFDAWNSSGNYAGAILQGANGVILGSDLSVLWRDTANPGSGLNDVAVIRTSTNTIGVTNGATSNPSPGDVEAGNLVLQGGGDGSGTDGTLTLLSDQGAKLGVVLDTGPSYAFLRVRQEGSLGYVGYEGSEVRLRANAGGSVRAALQQAGGLSLSSDNNIFWEDSAGVFGLHLRRSAVGVLTVQRFTGSSAVTITGGNDNTPTQFDGFTSGRAQEGRVQPNSSSSDMAGFGLLAAITETDFSSSLQVTSSGNAFRQTTNTPIGNVAGWDVGTDIIHFQAKPWACFVFATGETSNQRSFVGISDQTMTTMVGADDPAGNYIGLQARDGDTNYHVVHKDGTTLTRVDTGIALSTTRWFLVIDAESTTSVIVTLKNADGSSLFTTTITSGLPAGTTLFEPVVGTENTLGGTGRSIDTYSATLVLRS